MGRWYRVVAGVAVIAATASACQGSPAGSAGPPAVTMARLGPAAQGGVIGSGTVNGKPWRFRLVSSPSWSGSHQCLPTASFAADCAAGRDHLWDSLAGGAPVYFETIGPGVYGRVVDPRVSRLSARLSSGVVLDLRPVEANGLRWVALVVPAGLSLVQVTVYSGTSELLHAVPFRLGGDYLFNTWLPPGDAGPARVTKAISPRLVPSARLYTGPWGNCVIGAGVASCWPFGQPVFGTLADSGVVPRVVLITFRPVVSYLVLFLSDGKVSPAARRSPTAGSHPGDHGLPRSAARRLESARLLNLGQVMSGLSRSARGSQSGSTRRQVLQSLFPAVRLAATVAAVCRLAAGCTTAQAAGRRMPVAAAVGWYSGSQTAES